MRKIGVALLLLVAVALGACKPLVFEPTASPEPTVLSLTSSTPTLTVTALPSPVPTRYADAQPNGCAYGHSRAYGDLDPYARAADGYTFANTAGHPS